MVANPNRHPRVPASSPTLAGARVRLRPVAARDLAGLLEISVYDGVAARTAADVRAQLDQIAADQARGETVHWAIADAATDELVGTVGFYRGFPDGVGEVGYVLRPDHRGRGFMTEAVGLAVAHGFDALGLTAVVAHTDASNRASIAVLERCGFAPTAAEGEQRTFRLRRADAGDSIDHQGGVAWPGT